MIGMLAIAMGIAVMAAIWALGAHARISKLEKRLPKE